MALLMVARQYLTWWPLHPLGFAISTNAMTNYIWFSVFLAWLIKGLVLKYGGPALFQRLVLSFWVSSPDSLAVRGYGCS